VSETVEMGSVRTVRYVSGTTAMEFSFDPYKETILSRRWNGTEDRTDHFEVEAPNAKDGLFRPPTLFGREIFP
jgi:hypothetical protein